MHDVSSQPKVTDLHNFSLSQEDITSSQVTVHTLYGEKWSCSRTCFFHDCHSPYKRADFLDTVLPRSSTEQAPANRGKKAPGLRTSKESHGCILGRRRQKRGHLSHSTHHVLMICLCFWPCWFVMAWTLHPDPTLILHHLWHPNSSNVTGCSRRRRVTAALIFSHHGHLYFQVSEKAVYISKKNTILCNMLKI